MTLLYDRVENIVGKGENAGSQHFLPFPQCLKFPSSKCILLIHIKIVQEDKTEGKI